MSYRIEDHLTLTQKYILLLVEANNKEPITGKIGFKRNYFWSHKTSQSRIRTAFEGSLMGHIVKMQTQNLTNFE
jgi:hypothetical protein